MLLEGVHYWTVHNGEGASMYIHLMQLQETSQTAMSRLKWRRNVIYDGPNGSLFISMLLHNFKFRILNSEICTANFGIRNCEVYVVWASGNS